MLLLYRNSEIYVCKCSICLNKHFVDLFFVKLYTSESYLNKSVICSYKGTHGCSFFTACLMIMSTCRIFMLSCQILLSELWQHSKYIYVTVIFPTVNNQIRLFFLKIIFTLFTCKNNQLFKDSLSKFKNTFYNCIVDRKNIPIHCQCLRNSSMFSLCFTILWPFLIIHKLCVIITIQVLLCIFIKRTPFMSHYFISDSWFYIIKCRHFKNIEETMN